MVCVRVESGEDNFRIQSEFEFCRNGEAFFLYPTDMDNPNLIVRGCVVGYDFREIRRIWIIHK
jgi:hypothetical protein